MQPAATLPRSARVVARPRAPQDWSIRSWPIRSWPIPSSSAPSSSVPSLSVPSWACVPQSQAYDEARFSLERFETAVAFGIIGPEPRSDLAYRGAGRRMQLSESSPSGLRSGGTGHRLTTVGSAATRCDGLPSNGEIECHERGGFRHPPLLLSLIASECRHRGPCRAYRGQGVGGEARER